MEIKDKLTVTRGERGGGQQGTEGEGLLSNMHKAPTDRDNGEGRTECGRWGWVGGRVMGENGDNCNCTTIKK